MNQGASSITTDMANEYLEPENRDRQTLSLLLDKFARKDRIVVQRTEMGGTEAYVGSISLEWFASRVRFASCLPLLQQKYNPETDNIEIDADTIEEIKQRPLDWSRQLPLSLIHI